MAIFTGNVLDTKAGLVYGNGLGLLEIMRVFFLSRSLVDGRYAMFNERRELQDNFDADAI